MNSSVVGAPGEEIVRLLLTAVEKKTLRKCTLSKPADPALLRAELDLIRLGNGPAVRVRTFLRDGKAIQKNIPADGCAAALDELCRGFSQINLMLPDGGCEYRRSKAGREVLLGGEKAAALLAAAPAEGGELRGNDNVKERLLRGDEPFLVELGVSSREGRIYDKKQGKFRQICRFLEYVRDVEKELPAEGRLRICDLCCGKSYLSFAVYHYFAVVRHREVYMTGVDLKPDVIAFCADTAAKLGFAGLEFICGDALKYETAEPPQLVVSLHACDIATDIVLHRAAGWQARVILSTPCCHHELSGKIDCEPLDFVARYPILRRKLCDALTDGLRLSYLRQEGYAVDACELVDPDDTPKNIPLRAVRRRDFDPCGAEARKLKEEYRKNMEFLTREGLWGYTGQTEGNNHQ